jgi:hypothetical protein
VPHIRIGMFASLQHLHGDSFVGSPSTAARQARCPRIETPWTEGHPGADAAARRQRTDL